MVPNVLQHHVHLETVEEVDGKYFLRIESSDFNSDGVKVRV
jgi:hypothetical protein